MEELNFIIDGQPISKKRNYKIIRIGGRLSLGMTKKYQEWEKSAKDQLWIQKTQYQGAMIGMWSAINEPVAVEFLFFIEGRGKYDLSNLYQGPEDVLEQVGILANDSLIMSHDGSRKYLGHKSGRVLIKIKPFFQTEAERLIQKRR